MNMDRKALAAIVLCLVFYLGYTQYLQEKYPDYGKRGQQTAEEPAATPATTPSTPATAETAPKKDEPAAASDVPKLSPEELRVETKDAIFEFAQDTAAIKSIRLRDYGASKDSENGEFVELLDSALRLQPTLDITQEHGKSGFGLERQGNTFIYTNKLGDWNTRQTITVPEAGYQVGVKVEFQNTSASAQELTAGLWLREDIVLPKSGGFFAAAAMIDQRKGFVGSIDQDIEHIDARGYCEDDGEKALAAQNQKVEFVGFDKHYFLMVLQPKAEKTSLLMGRAGPVKENVCPMILTVYEKFGMVQPNESVTLDFSGYMGPKDIDILTATDPILRGTIDLGWFSIVAMPLLSGIKAIYKGVNNYGVAIIILTVLLKILFYPLTKAAAVSMKKMQKLQPEMQRIRERHKDDPRRQQQELMQFMAKHKVNPAKGCLPILPQIPVFIAFYNVLSNAIELRHAEFFGWIRDLSTADPYYISPILLGVGMFAQQKLSPNPGMDKSQEKIMMMLPVVFTVMMLSLPSGLVLYMITNTIVSIGQQQWLNRKLAKIEA